MRVGFALDGAARLATSLGRLVCSARAAARAGGWFTRSAVAAEHTPGGCRTKRRAAVWLAVAALLTAALPARAATDEPAAAAAWRYDPVGKRDPFRPVWLTTQKPSREKIALTPLQSYEISQLRLVGLIVDLEPPRALVEDASGLGFILVPGTPIGPHDGRVARIGEGQVVVEEWRTDVIGQRRRTEIVLELPLDEEVEP